MSYFRDLFVIGKTQGKQYDSTFFYNELIDNHRVVRITKEKDDVLTAQGYRSHRPKKAYKKRGIEIYEKELWDRLYDIYD